jgi:uncharacterized membrane protein YgaE (UPF0421/DUF939 family)
MENALFNSLKITAAAIAAVLLSELFSLDNAISAGIIAILTILPTKKETLRTAGSRLAAFVIALVTAFLSFHLCGFDNRGFFVYLAGFILICQIFGWYSAMAMDSVIISHFLTFGDMSGMHLINEILLFGIGVGIGILANLHLHGDPVKMEKYRRETDHEITMILRHMAERLPQEEKSDYNCDCFQRLDEAIFRAEDTARTNAGNQILHTGTYDLQYLAMRKTQRQILMNMDQIVRRIHSTPSTLQTIADFLMKITKEYEEANPVMDLLTELDEITRRMKRTPLPSTRTEFEDRAMLYSLLACIHEFLSVKAEFIRSRAI